jgi:hypothetical protein
MLYQEMFLNIADNSNRVGVDKDITKDKSSMHFFLG